MKCQILFSGKNKKNISKCYLLKILPRVLSVKCTSLSLFSFIYILFPKIRPCPFHGNCLFCMKVKAFFSGKIFFLKIFQNGVS